jgi:GR25 family glycosyltransferase involved in LPS biosynthesis
MENNNQDSNSQLSIFDHTVYINLEHRTDRKEHVEKQLASIGIKSPIRFNAIKLSNGALGCSMSHLKCLQMAKDNKWPHVLICEDDIQFLNPLLFLTQLTSFLKLNKKHNSWDVILLAGNNMLPYEKNGMNSIKVHHCLTTTGYIVKEHYYDILIQNYKEGSQKLMREPDNKKMYAIDKYWIKLQEKDNWFLITPLSVVQMEDYSDIENKKTDFRKYMLDYNKCYK